MRYSTIVVFGSEQNHSVRSPEVLSELIERVRSLLEPYPCQLSCRGEIVDEDYRNIAPPEAALSAKTIERWLDAAGNGYFLNFEMFDDRWSDHEDALVYAGINKLWDANENGNWLERTPTGAENNVTIAVTKARGMGLLPGNLQLLSTQVSGFYGFIEQDVGWDQPAGCIGLRGRMIDVRWHDITAHDCERRSLSLRTGVPTLYQHMVLCNDHFIDVRPSDLSADLVEECRPLGEDVWYVKFAEDPKLDQAIADDLARFINVFGEYSDDEVLSMP